MQKNEIWYFKYNSDNTQTICRTLRFPESWINWLRNVPFKFEQKTNYSIQIF